MQFYPGIENTTVTAFCVILHYCIVQDYHA